MRHKGDCGPSGQVIEEAVGAFDQMQPIGGGAGQEMSAGV